MGQEYRERHIAFVSGLNGTTVEEVSVVSMIGPLTILMRNVVVPWLFPLKIFKPSRLSDICLKLLLDIVTTVLPIQLAFTGFSQSSYLSFELACVFALTLAVLLFCFCEYAYSDRVRPSLSEVLDYAARPNSHGEVMFLTYFRTFMNLATAVCICAVDFDVFPRRFAKTETYGYSLMDSGVGVFVVANALVSREVRLPSNCIGSMRAGLSKAASNVLTAWPLIALGLLRLIAVKFSNYHEHVSEYGLHWNFFFTLALVKVVSSLLLAFPPFRHLSGLLGIGLIVCYQYLLSSSGLKDVLLFGLAASRNGTMHGGADTGSAVDDRSNLFDANREGLLSSFGYISLYLIAVGFGRVLFTARTRLRDRFRLLLQLLAFCAALYALLIACETYVDQASRRMANLTYVVWIIFLSVEHIIGFLLVEVLVVLLAALHVPLYHWGDESDRSPFVLVEPCLWRAINRNGLLYFLSANLLTGLVNVVVPTLDVSYFYASAIIFVYLLLLSMLVYFMYVTNVKLKFS